MNVRVYVNGVLVPSYIPRISPVPRVPMTIPLTLWTRARKSRRRVWLPTPPPAGSQVIVTYEFAENESYDPARDGYWYS